MAGLPPAFGSWREFEALVDRGAATGSFPDSTYIWWDLRPHPRLGTIEVRICDAQASIETVSGIVALAQSLVATLAEAHEAGETARVQPVTLVDENKWRATRDGLDARLIDLEHDTERSAREAVMTIVERSEAAARRLGCADELESVERILAGGTGADEQLRVYEETGSLLAVAQWIAKETVEGT